MLIVVMTAHATDATSTLMLNPPNFLLLKEVMVCSAGKSTIAYNSYSNSQKRHTWVIYSVLLVVTDAGDYRQILYKLYNCILGMVKFSGNFATILVMHYVPAHLCSMFCSSVCFVQQCRNGIYSGLLRSTLP